VEALLMPEQPDQESPEFVREKRQHSFWLDQQLYDSFKKVAQLLGKTSVSEALEEAMREWVKTHIDELPTQTTITIVESKQANIDLVDELELKIVKEETEGKVKILERLLSEKPVDDRLVRRWRQDLSKSLPKAIRIYNKTKDPELEQILARVKKLI